MLAPTEWPQDLPMTRSRITVALLGLMSLAASGCVDHASTGAEGRATLPQGTKFSDEALPYTAAPIGPGGAYNTVVPKDVDDGSKASTRP